jgi:AraC family transcriptional activator of pobA
MPNASRINVAQPTYGGAATPAYSLYGEGPELGQSIYSNAESIFVRSKNLTNNIEMHLHRDLYQFVYISIGKSTLVTPAGRKDFGDRTLLLVPPNFEHGFNSYPEIETRGHVITISDFFFGRMAQRGLLVADVLDSIMIFEGIDPIKNATLIESIEKVIQEHHEFRYPHVLAREASVQAFIVEFLRLLHERNAFKEGRDAGKYRDLSDGGRIKQLSWLIDKYYKSHKNVNFYAKQLGVSASNLNKLAVIATGGSVHANLRARIMEEARAYLANTSLSVKEIAYRLGYEDAAYFTRFFTKNAEMSPIEYRRIATQAPG